MKLTIGQNCSSFSSNAAILNSPTCTSVLYTLSGMNAAVSVTMVSAVVSYSLYTEQLLNRNVCFGTVFCLEMCHYFRGELIYCIGMQNMSLFFEGVFLDQTQLKTTSLGPFQLWTPCLLCLCTHLVTVERLSFEVTFRT